MPIRSDGAAFLDTSAFVKGLREEPGSAAFMEELERWPSVVASALLEVEAIRFGVRVTPRVAEEAAARVADVELVPIDSRIVHCAARVPPPILRSPDAIHLATALSIRDEVGLFLTYDVRLAQAAREHGFDVRSPGAESVAGRVRFPG